MKVVIKPIVALALLTLLVLAFDGADVRTRLGSANPIWIVVAISILLTQTAMTALRWRLVARCLGLRFSFGWAVREYFIAQIVNLTVPGGVVGDGARAVRSKAGEDGLKRATQAVVMERVAGQMGLLAVGTAGAVIVAAMPGALNWPPGLVRGLALVAIGTFICTAIGIAVFRGGRVASLVAQCFPTPKLRAIHFILSIGTALMNVAAFAACARAVGIALPPGAALLLVPLILTAMVIPLGIGGWGWREGAAAILFPIVGFSAASGVATGILFGIAMLIGASPGIPFLIFGRREGVRDTGRKRYVKS